MAKKMKSSRRGRSFTETTPEVRPKFQEQRASVPPLKPMNAKQKDYISYIRDKDLVLATGYAGTSKTYIPIVMAADMLRANKIRKIVITRPAISNSASLGYFGGDLNEKMANWIIPVLNILKERMGVGAVDVAVKNGQIEFLPLEVVKGYSAEDCFFICDEAEDITVAEAKKLVTRQGKNCTMTLSGDCAQSELGAKSGLLYLVDVAKKFNLNVGVVDFNEPEDIVRSGACKEWVLAMAEYDSEN